MKNIRILVLFLVIGASTSSCLREVFCEEGDGPVITETFIIDDFTGIDLEERASVVITQGSEQKVEVTASENILDKLRTEVNGGIWDIDLGKGCFQDLDLAIDITVPFIDELHISGPGTITVEDFTDLADVKLSITGSGNLELGQFTGTKDLEIKISGSGEILATESMPDLETLSVSITGSGDLDAFALTALDADAKISGSGDIFLTIQDYINVKITGSGDLHYKGNPLFDANITGSGKIVNEN